MVLFLRPSWFVTTEERCEFLKINKDEFTALVTVLYSN